MIAAQQTADLSVLPCPPVEPTPPRVGRASAPVTAIGIPIRADGSPDAVNRSTGTLLEYGPEGLTLLFDRCASRSALIVGIRVAVDQVHYAGVMVTETSRQLDGRIKVHAYRGGPGHDLLQPARLTPRFDFETMSCAYGWPTEVLQRWVELGVLQPIVFGQLQLCPHCQGLPSVRRSLHDLTLIVHCPHCDRRFSEQDAITLSLQSFQALRFES